MSKPQYEATDEGKRIVNFDDVPILADLELPDLLKEFRKYHVKEKDAKTEMESWQSKKRTVGEGIRTAIEAADADIVLYTSGKKEYRATLVKSEGLTATDEDRLRENMMKIGKLDAELVAKIFKFSQTPVERKPYILLTVKDGKNG